MSLVERAARIVPKSVNRVSPRVVGTSGRGSYVKASDGRRLLDLTMGIGVCSVGHCHPSLVSAVQEQAGELMHGQLNCSVNSRQVELAERLAAVMPSRRLDSFAFGNSGSEAVEMALKLARQHTGRTNVVVFQGALHGRSVSAGAMTTAKTSYSAGFQPSMSGVSVAPYAYCHRCPVTRRGGAVDPETGCCGYAEEQLDLLFKQQTDPRETAAIFVEPMLGEGGYVLPPKSWMRKLRAKADEVGCLLVVDEVQTGFGRTGTMFLCEQHGVEPDILVMAKGIAGGMPLSAIGTRRDIMDTAWPNSIGGTYGGNAVSCAAALAVLDVFEKENVLANVVARGKQFKDGLRAMAASLGGEGTVGDVRGAGLMLAMEFGDAVPAGTAAAISADCADNEDMLVLTAGLHEALRFIPSLLITEAEVDDALARLERSARRVLSK